MDVKERIRQLMGEQHLTQKELAEKSGVGAVTISRILNGHFEPQAATLAKLADAFGKSVSEMTQENLYDTNNSKTIYGYIEYKGNIHRINGFRSLERFYTAVRDSLKASDCIDNKEAGLEQKPRDILSSPEGYVRGIIGAVIGEIVGSRFEFAKKLPRKKYKLFGSQCTFTDDTVLTMAIADALLHKKDFKDSLWEWGHRYPHAGFGRSFKKWMRGDKDISNDSKGNGCGMRVSPIGFYAKTLDEALELARQSAIISHNSMEGIKGAQSIAAAIYLARLHTPKEEIKKYIEDSFGYNLHLADEEIKTIVGGLTDLGQKQLAENTCPLAIIAFLVTEDYESSIKKAISYFIDTDTVACMTGGIAAAYYGVPVEIINEVTDFLPQEILDVINEFDGLKLHNRRITPKTFNRWGDILVYGSGENKNGETEGYSASRYFGASNVLEGIDGRTYAIPTVERSLREIQTSVDRFCEYATSHQEKTFLVTRIGCSKAGYKPKDIAPMFAKVANLPNIYLPSEFREQLL